MESEQFYVELGAKLDKSFDEAVAKFKSLDAMMKNRKEMELKLNLRDAQASLKKTRDRIEEIKSTLDMLNSTDDFSKLQKAGFSFGDLISGKAWTDLEKEQKQLETLESKLANNVNNLQDRLNNLNLANLKQDVINTGKLVEENNQKLAEIEKERLAQEKEQQKQIDAQEKSFKKLVKSAGRFALSLIGARTVLTAIRRGLTTYMSYNEELKNKLEGFYYAIGSLFAPLVEWLVEGFGKIVSYVNVIAQTIGLAGVNMDKFNKSSQKAKHNLASFDEINNLNTGDTMKSNFSLSAPENPVFATNLGLAIKDVFFEWDFNWESFFEKVIFGLSTITGGLIGFKLGGIPGALIGMTIGAGIGLVLDALVFDHDKKLDHSEVMDLLIGAIGGAIGGIIGFTVGGPAGALIGAVVGFDLTLLAKKVLFGETGEAKTNLEGGAKEIGEGAKRNIQNSFLPNDSDNAKVSNAFQKEGRVASVGLNTGIKTSLTENGRTLGFTMGENFGKGLKEKWEELKKWWKNLDIGTFKIKTPHFSVSTAEVGGILGETLRNLGINLPKFSVSWYDVGTNYVPNDQLAMVHKGEAVVPKKFNKDEFFGRGNEETNSLLQTLIEKVDNIEINPYTTVKDVGQASVKYINQQSRILGGSVV